MHFDTFRFQVGDFSCTAIRDASNKYPLAMFLLNVPRETYEPWFRQRGESLEEVELPYSCLLIETGRGCVLVDTGMGPKSLAPGRGRLLDLLRGEGVHPEEIRAVILSHAHPDHIGGVLAEDGKIAFPNARFVIFKQEWIYWTSNPTLAELPIDDGFRQGLAGAAKRNLEAIRAKLDILESETEILPGISALEAFGHTPGHMAMELSSRGQRLIFAADAVILPFNFEFPECVAALDHQPDPMVATRRRLLAKAANEKSLFSATHLPFPGIGGVITKGERFEWQPITTAVETRAAH